MLAVMRWWMPAPRGFENMYGVSQWALSYDSGLVRRGLLGAIARHWLPVIALEDIHRITLAAFCVFVGLLILVFYVLLKRSTGNGWMFRLILLFVAAPATLSLLARDLGRFDIFLVTIMLLALILLSLKRHLWLIPVLMTVAMFIHEGFLLLCAPTILAAMIFVYVREEQTKKMLATMLAAAAGVAAAFLILYNFGNPALPPEEFAKQAQSRAAYHVTELSIRECYFSVKDHASLAASSLYDAGSIANLFMALLMMSPVVLVLAPLWRQALKNTRGHTWACWLLLLSTLSGFLVVPIATDYGRWIAAATICNFFAVFFLVKNDVVRVEEFSQEAGAPSSTLVVFIVLAYLLFGPLHAWEPYPYKDNILYSSLSVIAVLLFNIGWYLRRRTVAVVRLSEA
jgi:hypothetical protein